MSSWTVSQSNNGRFGGFLSQLIYAENLESRQTLKMATIYKMHSEKSKRPKTLEDGEEESNESGFKPIKQKVLILSSRGVTARQRFLMTDLVNMLPHSKKDTKLDSKQKLYQLNELAELYNCNNILFFEARKHQDLYMWLAKAPNGPSFKMHVQNLHTMDELNLTGNCLKGSRPILSFDSTFDESPHHMLLKELFSQIFAVPKGARRSKPFVDHIVTLSIADGKIWFRNYQIVEKEAEDKKKGHTDVELIEIGPRFVMTIICVLEGSFGGPVIYENKEFVSPNQARSLIRKSQADKYKSRQQAALESKQKKKRDRLEPDELEERLLFA